MSDVKKYDVEVMGHFVIKADIYAGSKDMAKEIVRENFYTFLKSYWTYVDVELEDWDIREW